MTTASGGQARGSAADAGPLARELRLLLEALLDRSEPWLDRFTGEGGATDGGPAEPATCQWCPLCAVAAVARGERSELAARAGEHAAALLALLREVVESDAAGTAYGHGREGGGGRAVQHIVVRRGDGSPVPPEPVPGVGAERADAGGKVQRIEVRRQGPER